MADSVRAKNRSERGRKKDQLTRNKNRQERKTTAWQEREEAKQTKRERSRFIGLMVSLTRLVEDRVLVSMVVQEENEVISHQMIQRVIEAETAAASLLQIFELLRIDLPQVSRLAKFGGLKRLREQLVEQKLLFDDAVQDVLVGMGKLREVG